MKDQTDKTSAILILIIKLTPAQDLICFKISLAGKTPKNQFYHQQHKIPLAKFKQECSLSKHKRCISIVIK